MRISLSITIEPVGIARRHVEADQHVRICGSMHPLMAHAKRNEIELASGMS